MKYSPKGVGEFELNTIVLDLNGTLAVNGRVPDGVKEKINKLKELGFKILLFSGDQRGTALGISQELDIEFKKASTTDVAIGNARIDIGTFKHSKLRIGTLQAEGINVGILPHLDVLVLSINDALDLLINKDSFEATMRL